MDAFGLSPSPLPTSDSSPTPPPPSSSDLCPKRAQAEAIKDVLKGSDVVEVPNSREEDDAKSYDKDAPAPVPTPKPKSASELKRARKFQPPQLWGKSSGLLGLGDGSKLRDMLLSPSAWSCLTVADQQAILAKLPQSYQLNGAPDIAALENDDNFRNDCAHYFDNISEGRLTENWLTKAWKAHYKDQRGDFKRSLQSAFDDAFMANTSGQAEGGNKGNGKKTKSELGKQDGDNVDLDGQPASADDDKAKDAPGKNGLPKSSE
ncbi:hypothetical protein QBC36DRAFT_138598 [Triangularia setosa]|uniref:ASX DEUBAD domain-containing protein n=1 Tax=Triangularia setosa TaxID=2587417 RepID=A0AAN6WBV3_9PEZI|nr:hypothetical protein QBC36DRAFT_138598 [Podospora setosa]